MNSKKKNNIFYTYVKENIAVKDLFEHGTGLSVSLHNRIQVIGILNTRWREATQICLTYITRPKERLQNAPTDVNLLSFYFFPSFIRKAILPLSPNLQCLLKKRIWLKAIRIYSNKLGETGENLGECLIEQFDAYEQGFALFNLS